MALPAARLRSINPSPNAAKPRNKKGRRPIGIFLGVGSFFYFSDPKGVGQGAGVAHYGV